MVLSKVKNDNRVRPQQKKYGDMYARVVDTATKRLIANVWEYVKHWSSDEETAEEYELSSGE